MLRKSSITVCRRFLAKKKKHRKSNRGFLNVNVQENRSCVVESNKDSSFREAMS